MGDGVPAAVADGTGVWVLVGEGGADSGSFSGAQLLKSNPARRRMNIRFLLIPPTILLQVDPLGVKLLA
jgi:hypothetical protein